MIHPLISVVIPTLGRPKSLNRTLNSLVGQTYKNFEIIIVDATLSKITENLADDFKDRLSIVYRRQEGQGIIPAIDQGFNAASGQIITRTDDDIQADPFWLREIVNTFNLSEDIGGVTGPTVIPESLHRFRDFTYFNDQMLDPPNILWKIARNIYHGYIMENRPMDICRFFKSGAFSISSNYEKAITIKGPVSVDKLESCNWSVRKELLFKAGGIDKRFKGVGEYFEVDIEARIKRLGYRLFFNPQAKVFHLPDTEGAFICRTSSYTRSQNFILFYFKNIKPDTLDKFLRFSLYVLLINCYWLYGFLKSGNLRQLSGIMGTPVGAIKYLPEIFRS